MLWIVLVFGALALAYWFLSRPHKYWIAKGVPQGNPVFLFGDNWGLTFQKQSPVDLVQMIYKVAPNARYSGTYQFLMPTLLLRDPDLIKEITIKKFDHFLDHRTLIPEESDPLMGKNLFSLTGKKWRNMRSTISPAFTSSKMRYMFSTMSQTGEKFIEHFVQTNEDFITIELKDALTRFMNDVIANTAFGVECNSLVDRENEFYLMGKDMTTFGFPKILTIFGYLFAPSLLQMFQISLLSKKVREFFYDVVNSNIERREKHGIVRRDMIHLLVEARKNGFKHEESEQQVNEGFATVKEPEVGKTTKNMPAEITNEEITSQAISFFLGGFDTVAAVMCFISHELAINPEVQERLIQEVDDTWEACHGKLTYEALLSMKYMDMVVSETLRKWPPVASTDRICTKEYIIEPKNPDEKLLLLKKNDVIMIPIYGLHHDVQYYPDPERFHPERFSDDNKRNIQPCTFIPFGSGPRNCIGSRFALLNAKTLMFNLLSHFRIVPVEKTQIPLVLSKKSLNLTAENGFWLGLKRRLKTSN